MIYVQVEDNVIYPVPVERLEQAALAVLRHQHTDEAADLTIVLADDAHLRQLNREFMGIDAPTDVLSFPADLVDPDSGQVYLGDILISLERAAAQAAEAGQPVLDELLLLTVHGVLHLLGHDHAEPEEKTVMWAAQEAVLAEVKKA